MGYWGWIVVAKGDSALAKHPAVTAYGQDVLVENVRGDWREIWLDDARGSDDRSVTAIVHATGAPAMAVYVADEDCAVIHAASPSGASWIGVFEEAMALEYGAVPPGYDRAEVLSAALAWAAEAGLTADADRAAAAFAEGWYSDLLKAVGLPEAVETLEATG